MSARVFPCRATLYTTRPAVQWRPRNGPKKSDLYSEGPKKSDLYSEGPQKSDIYSEGHKKSDLYSEGPKKSDLYSEGPKKSNLYSDSPEKKYNTKISQETQPWQFRAAFSGRGPKKSNHYLEGQPVLKCAIFTLIAHYVTSGLQRT
jgi:hypothetical protein